MEKFCDRISDASSRTDFMMRGRISSKVVSCIQTINVLFRSFVDAFYRNDITSGLFCPPHKITQPALQRKKNISLPQRKTNVVLSLSLMLQLHSEQMDPCFIFIGMHLLNWGKRKRGEKMQENESQERKQRQTERQREIPCRIFHPIKLR